MGFGPIDVRFRSVEVNTETERGIFGIDIEFASVYSKHQVERVRKAIDKMTVDDIIDLLNKVEKRNGKD